MLSAELNDELTRVSAGTPMGELMRRYWHPIAATMELEERPTKAVRLMGEDLVLYKDRSGTYGLIDRVCPHRRVDLSYGIPEEHGLRCMYHGWMFDETGQCIEQPFEETVHPDGRFKEKVKIAGYPIEELGGLLFAYLGPQPAPLLPRWEQLVYDDAVRDIAISNLPCNWLQCQENSLDAVHSEWLHNYYSNYIRSGNGVRDDDQPTTTRIAFDEFKHGIIKRRLQAGFPEDGEDWAKGHPVMFPNILWVGSRAQTTTQWRVPVDDENTLHVSYYVYRAAPGTTAPKQEMAAYRYVPLYEPDGRIFVDITFNQDYMAWITQGRIADRTKEILGQSDVGIILFRKQLRQQLRVVEDGGDPMNVFRTAEEAGSIQLPMEDVKHRRRSTGRYRPGENGVSPIIPLIEEAVKTWADPAR